MRILILSQFCDPEPTFKGLVFARELRKLGHDVQILTGFPNYPGGVIFPGYRIRLFQRESIEGISIVRVPLYPSHDNSNFKRMVNYISFALFATIPGLFLIKKPDLIYVYYTHPTVELPALMLELFSRVTIVYDIMDLWPDTLDYSGMKINRPVLKTLKLWCRFSYRMADHIVVASPSQKKILQDRHVPEGKISLIYNWCSELQKESTVICSENKHDILNGGHFNIVFAGNMGKAQGLDAVLEAAIDIRNRLPEINIIFIGWGVDVSRLKQIKEENNISNVSFLPPVPVSQIGNIIRMADALLVHLRDLPLFEMTIPSKTQAYLAVGRPVIMAVRGDAAELVERAGAGITCIPENTNSISSAIQKMYHLSQTERNIMGNNGFRFYWQELSLNIGVNKFNRIFNSLVSN